jgi:deazaflavin-dependent oxidoreductase (nitroreductase family)
MTVQDATKLHGDEHVKVYRETGGEVGHLWREGSHTLLLTTTGRKSGEKRTHALIYGRSGDNYLVVASNGGSEQHPGWYLNLKAEPRVQVQVMDEVFYADARDATPEERPEMWDEMTGHWPAYDDYQQKTGREIPVVVLEPWPR